MSSALLLISLVAATHPFAGNSRAGKVNVQDLSFVKDPGNGNKQIKYPSIVVKKIEAKSKQQKKAAMVKKAPLKKIKLAD